ncbi:acyl-CoA dehydrogenase family protein [Sphingomonas sp. GB1N7]|uniref:acyl-CoA dehydrogenase family protein n=1 Tax=Parasphingomonas caseinilytica TaxID=3096158 RepID=UPI002FC91430
MDFTFTPEQDMLRDTARGYVDRFLKPHEKGVEQTDHLDLDIFRDLRMEAVKLGLYAHNLPESMGGGGLDVMSQVVIGEELGKTSMALADAIGFLPATMTLASEAQRDWFTDPLVSGDKTVAYALTEPDAGSDLSGLRTRATREDGHWVVNGGKQFISGADFADFIILLVVTDPPAKFRGGYTLFIIDRDNPGFHYLGAMKKMGWRGYQVGAFSLQDCIVEDSHVLGEVGGGFGGMMSTINTTRIEYAGRYVGMADELMRLGVEHANTRRTFGATLGSHQMIQTMLADSDCELQASRLLAYQAADLADRGDPAARVAGSRAKLYASEMVGRVADRVLQIFGGTGYMCDLPIERMYRDARAFRIGEGTSEMQRIQIARALLAA